MPFLGAERGTLAEATADGIVQIAPLLRNLGPANVKIATERDLHGVLACNTTGNSLAISGTAMPPLAVS
jgi:hypothetical protein